MTTVNSSPIHYYDHPDDHAQATYEMTPGDDKISLVCY